MRIIFAGTPEDAVFVLEALADSNHEVCAVLTQPDRPKGRGRQPAPPPVKEFALKRGIPVLQPEKVNSPETLAEIEKISPDVAVVAFYGRIIGAKLLAVPEHGWLNIHPSLLPKYRGPSPVPSAILSGEEETGVTIIKLDAEMDHGPVLLQMNLPIGENENAGELLAHLAKIGAEMTLHALDLVGSGEAGFTPQRHEAATFTMTLTKQEGTVDWSAGNLHNFVRAMTPWPGAHAKLHVNATKNNVDLIISRTKISAEGTSAKVAPGTIIALFPEGILVEDGRGETLITSVKPSGKKEMPAKDFANGYRVRVGDRFT
ncbi:MAG: methionyl-tRNA formyltransferase [Planctomycetota bacterium]